MKDCPETAPGWRFLAMACLNGAITGLAGGIVLTGGLLLFPPAGFHRNCVTATLKCRGRR